MIGIKFKAKSLNWDIDTNNDAFKAVIILNTYLHNNLKSIKRKLAELPGEMNKYMLIGGEFKMSLNNCLCKQMKT